MTYRLQVDPSWSTNLLLAHVLSHAKDGEHVQFLVDPSSAEKVVQRLRVALTRSRERNRKLGKKIEKFKLLHSIYPYTDESGKRYGAIVMWVEKNQHHRNHELLDDLMERKN